METYSCYKESWFAIDLRDIVCYSCYLRDKRSQIPFLISIDNEMDPGDVPAYLLILTQVKKIIITRSHV
jgi:hypothetical protein